LVDRIGLIRPDQGTKNGTKMELKNGKVLYLSLINRDLN
jgi:hypothetical protein